MGIRVEAKSPSSADAATWSDIQSLDYPRIDQASKVCVLGRDFSELAKNRKQASRHQRTPQTLETFKVRNLALKTHERGHEVLLPQW